MDGNFMLAATGGSVEEMTAIDEEVGTSRNGHDMRDQTPTRHRIRPRRETAHTRKGEKGGELEES